MMTPQLISASASVRNFTEQGPFYHGGSRYIVLNYSSSPFNVGVYRSQDGGFTWTEQDSANNRTPHASFHSLSVIKASNILYILHMDTGGLLNIGSFDMSNNLWSTAITGGPNAASTMNGVNARILLERRSDGSFVSCYPSNTASNTDRTTVYVVYSGGAWGTPVTITGTNKGKPQSLGVDASDRTHIIMGFGPNSTPPTPPDPPLSHRSLSLSNALGAETVITNSLHSGAAICPRVRVWTPAGGSATLSVLFTKAVRWSFMSSIVSLQGNPAHAFGAPADSPTWTIEDVSAGLPGFTTTGSSVGNRYGAAIISGNLYSLCVAPGATRKDIYAARKDTNGWHGLRKLYSTVGDSYARFSVIGFNDAREIAELGRIGLAFGLRNNDTGAISPYYMEL